MQKTLISKEYMFRSNLDTVIVCLALLAVGIYLNGALAVYQALVCVASCVLCELLGFHVLLKKKTLPDLGAVATGLIIAMLLPSCAPLWVGACAGAFAILASKLPFGDGRNAPFLPAAAGFCFAAMFFPKEVFTFSALSDAANTLFMNEEGFSAGISLLDMLRSGDSLTLNVFGISKLLSGKIPGAIGTVSLVALCGAAGYILVREPKRLLPSLGFLISSGLFAFLFPRINAGRLTSVVMEISAGSLLFVALIMINNPVNLPEKSHLKFIYGILGGVIAMLLRYFSALSDPCVFTVLIKNALWPSFYSKIPSDKKMSKGKESEVCG
ncbi:MAG: RnfABCDGE type electron transport complex subunit D [Clostridia bacterium]|nr:RnfABCDGE type electron transport complex subunit D [Clostridia bacterium]